MNLIENCEYIIQLKYDGTRSIRVPRHVIVANGELRCISDYYGDYGDETLFDINTVEQTHSVVQPLSNSDVEEMTTNLNWMLSRGFVSDVIELAKGFADKHNHFKCVVMGESALTPSMYNNLEWIIRGAVKGIPQTEYVSPFKFKVGETILTQNCKYEKIIGRSMDIKGYETFFTVSDLERPNKYTFRYDRSNSSSDTGRVCGSAHDYSHILNVAK